MGSHSATCHPAEVIFPPLPQPIKAGMTPEGCNAKWTSGLGYIQRWYTRPKTITHPSSLLTGPNIEQLRSCDERRYRYAKPPTLGVIDVRNSWQFHGSQRPTSPMGIPREWEWRTRLIVYSVMGAVVSALMLWQEGHPACKTEWWDAGVVICLGRGADLRMAQLMPLPLTVSLAPVNPDWFYLSGKRLMEFTCRLSHLSVCQSVCLSQFLHFSIYLFSSSKTCFTLT